MITLEDVRNNLEVEVLIKHSNKQLNELGFTEHGIRHVSLVANRAGMVLETLGYSKDKIELAKIAGYMHDIGNSINRIDHAQTGAILSYNILKDMGVDPEAISEIVMAVGNHDEKTGNAVSDISAALILADKSDVHRDRVMNKNIATFDIHDRVNYAVEEASLFVEEKDKKVILDLSIDTEICPVLDYFEIFMERTIMSKRAANFLKIWFELVINDTRLL